MISRRLFLRNVCLSGLAALVGGRELLAQGLGGATTHRVVRGDTLGELAVRYGVTVRQLREANRLKSDVIQVGQVLVIPAGAAVLREVIAATSRLAIAPKRWRWVVAHHSAIEDGNARSYDAAHRRRGMENGLAYDFVIGNGRDSGDGEIEIGPRWLKQLDGGHVRSSFYNEHGIGICLVGNFENRKPGARQMASFTALVDWLRDSGKLGIKPGFTTHRWVDKNHTLCPGRHFPYAEMRRRYA
jgi:LysM repeat protein